MQQPTSTSVSSNIQTRKVAVEVCEDHEGFVRYTKQMMYPSAIFESISTGVFNNIATAPAHDHFTNLISSFEHEELLKDLIQNQTDNDPGNEVMMETKAAISGKWKPKRKEKCARHFFDHSASPVRVRAAFKAMPICIRDDKAKNMKK